MLAMTKFEAVKFTHGPISPEIFTHEPNFENMETPTSVRRTRRDDDGLPYEAIDQVLDEQGRLIATHFDNHDEPYLTREWTGDDTYIDTLADGGRREVTKKDNGALVIVEDGEKKQWVLSTEEYPERTIYFARSPLILTSEGNLFVATVSADGKIEEEEVWNAYDYEEGFFPIKTFKYEYDEDDNLVEIKRMSGSGESGYFDYFERYARPAPDMLNVEGVYILQPSGDELIGNEQARSYDDQGRVISIDSRVSVPTSAMLRETIELKYE